MYPIQMASANNHPKHNGPKQNIVCKHFQVLEVKKKNLSEMKTVFEDYGPAVGFLQRRGIAAEN